jgi:hypothetical protein
VVADNLKSRTVEIKIRSDDIKGGFRIEAALPKEFSDFEEKGGNGQTNQLNPFKVTRQVRVYYGDLRTRVEIVSQDEASASFGPQFAKFFYVGRIFLRNRNHEKRLLVYTTSLRANALMYRPPVTNLQQIPNPHLTPHDSNAIANVQRASKTRRDQSLTQDEIAQLVDVALERYSSSTTGTIDERKDAAADLAHIIPRFTSRTNHIIRFQKAKAVILDAWIACNNEIATLRSQALANVSQAETDAQLLAAKCFAAGDNQPATILMQSDFKSELGKPGDEWNYGTAVATLNNNMAFVRANLRGLPETPSLAFSFSNC